MCLKRSYQVLTFIGKGYATALTPVALPLTFQPREVLSSVQIVSPDLEACITTRICPHTISSRSVIFPTDCHISAYNMSVSIGQVSGESEKNSFPRKACKKNPLKGGFDLIQGEELLPPTLNKTASKALPF